MSPATFPEALAAQSQPPADRVILITGISRDIELAEDLRKEIRQSGWDCEIFRGDVSDRTEASQLVHDLLDCVHHVGVPVNDAGITCDRFIRKMTDEEWLAQ